MGNQLTIAEVSGLTGLHENTIYGYCRNGKLRAVKELRGPGKEQWLVDEEDIYSCEVPTIANALDPKTARQFKSATERLHETETALSEREATIEEQNGQILELTNSIGSLREELQKSKKLAKSYSKALMGTAPILAELLEQLRSAKNVEKALEATGIKIATESNADDFRKGTVTFRLCGYRLQCDYEPKSVYGYWGKSFGGLYSYLNGPADIS
jgi:hypothetical protein